MSRGLRVSGFKSAAENSNGLSLSRDETNMLSLLGYSCIEKMDYAAALVLFEVLHHSAPHDRYVKKTLAHLYLIFMRYQEAFKVSSEFRADCGIDYVDAQMLEIQSMALTGLEQESGTVNK